jgi:integrase
LSAPARQLLAGIQRENEFVFPGQNPGAHRVEVKAQWANACKAAGISGVRMHDVRHTFASVLASAGMSLPIIGALLGHSQPATTARYAHLMDDPLRAATERAGAIVTAVTPVSMESVRVVALNTPPVRVRRKITVKTLGDAE